MRNLALASFLFTLCAVSSANAFGAEAETAKAKPYTLDTCATSGEKLGGMGDSVVRVYNGQEVKFCCSGCIKKFEKDVDGNVKKVQADMAKAAEVKAAGPKAPAPAVHDHNHAK
jgi:hypothetical protein